MNARIIFTETLPLFLARAENEDDDNDYRGMNPSFGIVLCNCRISWTSSHAQCASSIVTRMKYRVIYNTPRTNIGESRPGINFLETHNYVKRELKRIPQH